MSTSTSPYVWVVAIAAFWTPYFVASWLGDVKRTSEHERPTTWALLGWVGVLVFALKKPKIARDPELARQRSRIALFASLLALCGCVALGIYAGNQSSRMEPADVEALMLSAFQDPANETPGYTPRSFTCVRRSGNDFSCVGTFFVADTGKDESFVQRDVRLVRVRVAQRLGTSPWHPALGVRSAS